MARASATHGQPGSAGSEQPSENKMIAIVRYRYGSPDVLKLEDLDKPVVEDERVLVRVRAASLNADDLEYLYGRSPLARIPTGPRAPTIRGLAVDVGGHVAARGKA